MKNITVPLSGNLDSAELCKVFWRFAEQANPTFPGQVTIDLSKLTFILPAGVTFLSNFLHWLNYRGTSVVLAGCNANASVVKFLDDSLFFEQHAGKKLNALSRPRSTTIPLIRLQMDEGFAWLRNQLVPWLAPMIKVTKASLHPLQTTVAEIFNNIKDHSTLTIGSVFVQHYPNKNEVNISIADFGVGIPHNVRKVLPESTDSKAIVEATKEGFTSRSTPGNKGAGLPYLLNTVVMTNGGRVTIHSLSGHVLFTKLRNDIRSSELTTGGWCPGTTIDIVFRTGAIVPEIEEETEELPW